MMVMLIPVLLVLIVLGGIIAVGGARIMAAKSRLLPIQSRAETLPHIAAVMPVSGSVSIDVDKLASVLRQDYPAYEVVFSSMEGDAGADKAIASAMAGERKQECRAVRHMRTAPAVSCSQKNRNLLAGVSAVKKTVPVVVFCDSGHDFPAHWLRCLVEPLIVDGATVSSSYHHVIPGDDGIGTQGRAFTVLFLHCLKLVPMLSQPWGGSTACRRDLFGRLQVQDMWSHAVVDDVSLSRLLDRSGIRMRAVPEADAVTPLIAQTMGGWSAWLTRQLMYLKLFYPASWLVGGMAGMLTALSLIGFAMGGILWAVGGTDPVTGMLCLVGLGFFPCAILAMRLFHPAPGARLSWLGAGFVAVFMACWCHFRTWFSRRVLWSGVEYEVAGNGRVLAVRR